MRFGKTFYRNTFLLQKRIFLNANKVTFDFLKVMTSISLHTALILTTQALVGLSVFVGTAGAQDSLSAADLRRLNPFDIIELRDFVRGKGKGTVSRVPLGNEAESESTSISELIVPNASSPNDTDVIDFGQQVWKIVPQMPFASMAPSSPMSFSFIPSTLNKNSIVTKGSAAKSSDKILLSNWNKTTSLLETNNFTQRATPPKTKITSEPTEEEYERLAEILQTFVNRRKRKEKAENDSNIYNIHHPPLLAAKTSENTSLQREPIKTEENRSSLWPGLVEKTPKKFQKIALSVGTTNRDVNISTTSPSSIIYDFLERKDYDEENMRKKLNDINDELISMLDRNEEVISTSTTRIPLIYFPEHTRTASKAYVTVLREGIARQTSSGEYIFVASITLIRDSGKVILVDTGLSTDINGRTDLIQKLSKMNVAPPSVDYVITTHGHPDHAGNTNEFPDSVHFQGTISYYRNKFNFTDLFENEQHQLTSNVYLLRTPGHTSDDISVIVRNSDKYGTVAISGDVFIAGEDVDYPLMWKPLAWDVKRQETSRRTLTCLVDYILPGHGKVFKVTPAMRSSTSCQQLDQRNKP